MTFLFTIQTILEVIAVGFVIWGFFNEQKLVRFEERLVCAIRRRTLKLMDNCDKCHKHCA